MQAGADYQIAVAVTVQVTSACDGGAELVVRGRTKHLPPGEILGERRRSPMIDDRGTGI